MGIALRKTAHYLQRLPVEGNSRISVSIIEPDIAEFGENLCDIQKQQRVAGIERGQTTNNIHAFAIGTICLHQFPCPRLQIADLDEAEKDVALPLGVVWIALDQGTQIVSPSS